MTMQPQTPKEMAFKHIGFGNLNVLNLPSTEITLLVITISEAIDIALQERAKEIREWILYNLENSEQIIWEFDKKFSGGK